MIKYSWITDIHLDHLRSEKQFIDFCHNVVANEPTGIFITGDISDAKNIVYHLSAFEKIVQRPVYYVLGNHDYYSGDIESVRKSMRELTNVSAYLKYAQLTGYHVLSPKTALVGHDGWYDGLNGNANRSRFMMNDWIMIRDYIQHSGGQRFLAEGNIKDKPGLIAFSQKLAREGTALGIASNIDGLTAPDAIGKDYAVFFRPPAVEVTTAPLDQRFVYGEFQLLNFWGDDPTGTLYLNSAKLDRIDPDALP